MDSSYRIWIPITESGFQLQNLDSKYISYIFSAAHTVQIMHIMHSTAHTVQIMHSTAHTVQIMRIMHSTAYTVQIMHIMCSAAHIVQIMYIIKNRFQLQNLDSNYRIWIPSTYSVLHI